MYKDFAKGWEYKDKHIYFLNVWNHLSPNFKIEIDLLQSLNKQIATCVRLLGRNSNSKRLLGYVATLKDNFGFIETANHDKEVFFLQWVLWWCW